MTRVHCKSKKSSVIELSFVTSCRRSLNIHIPFQPFVFGLIDYASKKENCFGYLQMAEL
jgi:hypothetical protein